MSQTVVTVAAGADYLLDRAALIALITTLPGLQVTPLESDPPPRVLVWSAGSRRFDGLPCLEPTTALLLVVGGIEPLALPAGAAGLFSKNEAAEALAIAIRQVARGEQYLSPALALALLEIIGASFPVAAVEPRSLPEREQEILALLAEGLSNKAIAAKLYLSVRTVEGHLANVYARLDVHSRTEAVLLALQHDLASPTR